MKAHSKTRLIVVPKNTAVTQTWLVGSLDSVHQSPADLSENWRVNAGWRRALGWRS